MKRALQFYNQDALGQALGPRPEKASVSLPGPPFRNGQLIQGTEAPPMQAPKLTLLWLIQLPAGCKSPVRRTHSQPKQEQCNHNQMTRKGCSAARHSQAQKYSCRHTDATRTMRASAGGTQD